jgi:predicted phosphoadenosine phosphosulfate sulfurtransferase
MITRLFLQSTVLEESRKRMRFIFEEFGRNTYVCFSGGKDSTVILNLALEAATELDLLPVKVLFLDQETEWQSVIDYVRTVMHDPRVDARWLQIPILMNNASSIEHPWLRCWHPDEEAKWMRPKEPDSIHRNVYGTQFFKDMFPAFMKYHHMRQKVCRLTGMRAEESPGRLLTLTQRNVYKGVTWMARQDPKATEHYTASPIYDWSYTDVWKYIHEGGFPYCDLYNKMYQYGVPTMQMRVSNVHHEAATKTLYFLQEIEPETWARLTQRISGINSIGQLKSSFYAPKELPSAFSTWVEYRDYLLQHLTDDTGREYFGRRFATLDAMYMGSEPEVLKALWRTQIDSILKNDWEEGFMLKQWTMQHPTPKQMWGRNKQRTEWRKGANDESLV